METPFSDTGFNNTEVAATIFKTLRIGPNDLAVPSEFQKLKDIAAYFNGSPDPHFELGKVMRKQTTAKPIDHLWSYVELSRQKNELSTKLKTLEKQLNYYG